MTEVLSIRAGTRRLDVANSSREAVKVTERDLGDAEMSAVLAQGLDGGVRSGPGDWGESRTVTLDLDCSYGNVPGDASGRAINRALTGRTVQTVQAAAAGDISVQFGVDATDRNPTTVDMACEVRSSMAGTVHMEALRAGSVVATTSRTVAADGVGRNGVKNPRFANGATGWTAGGFITSAGFTGVTQAPGDMPDGSGTGFRVAATNPTATARSAGVVADTPAASNYVPVVAGQSMTFGVRGAPVTNSALGWRAEVYFYQADGTTYAGTLLSTALQTGTGTRYAQLTVTAPALAAFARVAATVQSSAAESFDVWFSDVFVGDVDYYADGDSPGWAWSDVAAPHASASRRVVGAWSEILLPAASIPGTGVLTMRARLASATAGAYLEARNPVFGEGLSCRYHDQYTPGAVGTAQGRSIRPASGEAWSNAFVAGVSSVVGAVRQEGSPTLVRSADDLAESGTLDLHRASAPAAQDGKHAMGYGTMKVTASASPLWRLTPRVWPGTVTNTTVGAMPVWRASLPIPGDDDAIGSAVATFSGARRDAIAIVASEQPVAIEPTPANAGWALAGALTGAIGAAPINGYVPKSLAPVAEYASPVEGRYHVDVRLQMVDNNVGGIQRVSLNIDGRQVAATTIESCPASTPAMQVWRWARFGVQSIRSGSRVQVAIGAAVSGDACVDVLCLTRATGAGTLIEVPDDEIPSGTMVGDDAPNSTGATLNGRIGVFGATWSAPAGWGWTPGTIYSPAGDTTARFTAQQTLGAVLHCTADGRLAFGSSPTGQRLGLFTTAGGLFAAIEHVGGGELCLSVNPPLGGPWTQPIGNFGAGAVVDLRLQVDLQGRILAQAALAGVKLQTVVRAHCPEFAASTLYAAVRSTAAGSVDVRSLRFMYGTTATFDDSVEWSAGQGQRLVVGGTPRFAQGTRPYVFVRAAANALDSPSAPNLHPTAYAVTITPRVLQVPR